MTSKNDFAVHPATTIDPELSRHRPTSLDRRGSLPASVEPRQGVGCLLRYWSSASRTISDGLRTLETSTLVEQSPGLLGNPERHMRGMVRFVDRIR